VLDSYFNLTNKPNLNNRRYNTFFDHLVVAYHFGPPCILQPIAVEAHGAFSASALSFLTTLGEHFTGTSGDLRENSFLFRRLSVIIQRFNSVLIHESFNVSAAEEQDLYIAIPTFDFSFIF